MTDAASSAASEVISSVTAEKATAGIAAPQAALTPDHEAAVRLLTLTEKDAEETEIDVVALVDTIDAATAEAILQTVAVVAAVVGVVKEEKAKERIGEPLVMTADQDHLRLAVARTLAQVLGTRTATVVTGVALLTIVEVIALTVPTVTTLIQEVLVAIEGQDPGTMTAVMVAHRAVVAQKLSLHVTETMVKTLRTMMV